MINFKIVNEWVYFKESIGYKAALEVCGAKILEYKEFGSYQGDWYAILIYNEKTLLIGGGYGSCSGCDSFQSDFSGDNVIQSYEEAFPEELKAEDYDVGYKLDDLKKFGLKYLNDPLNIEDIIKEKTNDLVWDNEAQEIINWINTIKNNYTFLKWLDDLKTDLKTDYKDN